MISTSYKFYSNNIIRWELLLKLGNSTARTKSSVIGLLPRFSKINLFLNLHVANESEFKIIKAVAFFKDLFRTLPTRVKIFKTCDSMLNKSKVRKAVKLSLICSKDKVLWVLYLIHEYITQSIVKKQVPFSFGMDTAGTLRISFNSLGELGIPIMYYDYFNWKDPLVIEFYSETASGLSNNLLFSYFNFKFILK